MSYEKQTWQAGDTITSAKLNHMEDGIAGASLPPATAENAYQLLGVDAEGNYALINAEYGYDVLDPDWQVLGQWTDGGGQG